MSKDTHGKEADLPSHLLPKPTHGFLCHLYIIPVANLSFLYGRAWLDAALTLVELELPGWGLRRLYRDAGTWFCSLSHQPNVSAELDDTADGSHEVDLVCCENFA